MFKHAQAKRVCVRLAQAETGFEIVIEDDGVGLAEAGKPPRAGAGNGLGNMRERMRQVDGDIEIQSRTGQGTRVCLRLRVVPRVSV